MGQPGGLIGKFKKNRGLGIGVGNAFAASLLSRLNHFPGRAAAAHDGALVIGGHLGDIGILAESAPKIAAHRGNGVRQGIGQKMKQGFFFDGINMPGNQITVNQGFEDTIPVFAHRAYSAAAVFDHTAVAAQIAFDFFVLQRFPETSFHNCSIEGLVRYAGQSVNEGNYRPSVLYSNSARLKYSG